MVMGRPFQGQILFSKETSYSAGTAGVSIHLISDKVLDVRIEHNGDVFKGLRGISSPSVCAFISQPSDYTVHIEWVSQATAYSLASYCVNRSSIGSLESIGFFIGANVKAAQGARSYFNLKGCVAKNLRMSASRGNEYIFTADFSVASVGTASKGSDCGVKAANTAFAQFNIAGDITQTGGTQASITNSIEINVDNDVYDYWDVHGKYKQGCMPGTRDITVNSDISLDDGGKTHWDEVLARTLVTSLVVDTGIAIWNTWTLSNGHFNTPSIDINASSDGMMTTAPSTFKNIVIS